MSVAEPIKRERDLKEFKEYYLYIKPNPRNYALIITGLNTALRISDILHLKWDSVFDFNKKKWHTHVSVKEQKTGKTNNIYINKEIKKALISHIKKEHPSKNNYIFRRKAEINEPLSRSQAFRIIKEATTYVGINANISCHSLRKTFGYHAWKQGVPPALLMDIYNHSSYQVTKRYLCINQDEKDEVYKRIRL